MLSKNDSDSTYCSEVEKLLKGQSASKGLPVRRSQRLSQKLQKVSMAAANDCFSCKNIFECSNGKRKQILSKKDIPLDLSRKSKVLKLKTAQDGNATHRFSMNEFGTENSLETANDGLKENVMSCKQQNENSNNKSTKCLSDKGSRNKYAEERETKSTKNPDKRCTKQTHKVSRSIKAKSSSVKSSERNIWEEECLSTQRLLDIEQYVGSINDVKIKHTLGLSKIGSQTTSPSKCFLDKKALSQKLSRDVALRNAIDIERNFENSPISKKSNQAELATQDWKSEQNLKGQNDFQSAVKMESKLEMNLYNQKSNNKKSTKRVQKQTSEFQSNKKLKTNNRIQKETSENRFLANLQKQSQNFKDEKTEKNCKEAPHNARLNTNSISNEFKLPWILRSQTNLLDARKIGKNGAHFELECEKTSHDPSEKKSNNAKSTKKVRKRKRVTESKQSKTYCVEPKQTDVKSDQVGKNGKHFEIECENIEKERLSQILSNKEIIKVFSTLKSSKKGRTMKKHSESQCNKKYVNTCYTGEETADCKNLLQPLQNISKSFHVTEIEKNCSGELLNNIPNVPSIPNGINSNRVFRSEETFFIKGHFDERLQKVCKSDTHIGIESEKIKKEKLSQKVCEEGIEAFKHTTVQPVTTYTIGDRYGEDKMYIEKLKSENLNTESPIKSKQLSNILKPITLKKLERTKQNRRSQTKTSPKEPITKKNYLKSFDKNKFLTKIQNVQTFENKCSFENVGMKKISSIDVPPTPAESSEELLKKSILNNAYPAYFKDQLPPEAILTRSLDPEPALTPDDTISLELLNSPSTSPSLPESLCELFKTKDIKDILNMKRTTYYLNRYHVQALALILNLRLEFLLKTLDKVIDTCPTVLKNIDKAVKSPFVPDNDLFSTSPDEMWDSSNFVPNSQSSQ